MPAVMRNRNQSMSGKKETENEIGSVTEVVVGVGTGAEVGTGRSGDETEVLSEDPTETRTGRETRIGKKMIEIVVQRREAEEMKFLWRRLTSCVPNWVYRLSNKFSSCSVF